MHVLAATTIPKGRTNSVSTAGSFSRFRLVRYMKANATTYTTAVTKSLFRNGCTVFRSVYVIAHVRPKLAVARSITGYENLSKSLTPRVRPYQNRIELSSAQTIVTTLPSN